ncbi:DUF6387 family protein [Enterobacter asburiae]|uniref:DUF6387 family protein n=1 Tax=Enterobacter asburiae TaxID=61645 RepID=UPI0029667957|nr:DUF6387 family protein [Enterobacter asburiae]MDW3569287.1 DUF6387 family protein [Enterobacter asburiae]
MFTLPKDANELNEQLNRIADDMETCNEGFRKIRELDVTIQEITDRVDVKKYDEITKDFHLIQYYISFQRRRKIIDSLEYINEMMSETYEQYLLEGNDEISIEEYEVYKKGKIELEQYELKDDIYRILTGDNIDIKKEDLKYADAWHLSLPVRTIDMKNIAFENRRCGFIGGMEEKDYNDVICKVWSDSPTGEDIAKLRTIPDGYGWPTKGLSQHIWAEIDLNTPDDILFESFKNWVKAARELPVFTDSSVPYHLMSAKVIKPSHIKKWRALRILAYLDLKILSMLTNFPITLKQYGDILFFEDFDVDTTEKVRKTLIPLANDVLDYGYLDCMLKKVLAEN